MVLPEDVITGAGPGQHLALFHRGDADLAGRVCAYLGEGLQDAGAAVVIATPAHRALFCEGLERQGVDVAVARATGRYLELDAAETLNGLMLHGLPHPGSFWLKISPLIRSMARAGRRARVFGEMVALLWEAGRVAAAIELEALWNDLGNRDRFGLLCAYPAQPAEGVQRQDAVAEVCRLHTETIMS